MGLPPCRSCGLAPRAAGQRHGMRTVIVGATGNLGTALVRNLAHGGRTDLLAIARRPPGEALPEGVEFATARVEEDDLAALFEGADAVVHLAWLFQPTRRPEETWRVNVGGSEAVFGAAAASRVRTLVYASSVGAYSPAPGQVVDEGWPTHSLPRAAYGREKAYVERLLDAVAADNPSLRTVRVRPAFVFQRSSGTEQRRLFAGPFLPARLLRPGVPPVVPWVRGLRVQAVHADDVAEAINRVLGSDVEGAFNLAADPVVTGETMAELMEGRLLELPPYLVRFAAALAYAARLVPSDPALLDLVLAVPEMSSERARRLLGWSPEHSSLEALREGLLEMAEGAGGTTMPLAADSAVRRLREVSSGVGEKQ